MPNSDCPQCHGSGWIIAERSGITGAKRCECILADQQQENWDNAGIPPLYENASLDNFDHGDVLEGAPSVCSPRGNFRGHSEKGSGSNNNM